MKVSELQGADLDYWVAKAGKLSRITHPKKAPIEQCFVDGAVYSPTYYWEHGGPIIEREQIYLEPPHEVHATNYDKDGKLRGVWRTYETWHATVSARTRTWSKGPDDPPNMIGGRVGRGEGETPLIAAMRAYVESVFGDTVHD